jgi:hypothetical protein
MPNVGKYGISLSPSWDDMSMSINGVERVLQSPVAVSR